MGAIIVKKKLPREKRPWWHISRRLPRNPFDPQYPTEHLEYCKICKMDVDVDVEGGNAGGIDVYRKLCRRCGQVMQHGIAKRDLMQDRPLPKAALEFIKYRSKDRR